MFLIICKIIDLKFFKLQPSEFAKITSAIITAHFFYSHPLKEGYKLMDMKQLIVMFLFMFLLIFEQPDLGTAGVCLLIVATQLFFININKMTILRVFIFSFSIKPIDRQCSRCRCQ